MAQDTLIPYISRQAAEDLQNSFTRALAEPASYPAGLFQERKRESLSE